MVVGEIVIAPNAMLRLYVGGPNASLNQVLSDGYPTSFQYFGLPSNKAFNWAGNTDYAVIIYALQANVKMGGGGAATHNISRICVAQSVVINGTFNFHFDENLKRIGPMR